MPVESFVILMERSRTNGHCVSNYVHLLEDILNITLASRHLMLHILAPASAKWAEADIKFLTSHEKC
jgi:hypothetical protein